MNNAYTFVITSNLLTMCKLPFIHHNTLLEMKSVCRKMIGYGILSLLISLPTFGQNQSSTNIEGEKEHPKLELISIPKEVTEKFSKEYPVTSYESWYGYPSFTKTSDWYRYDPNLYSDKYPEYYIVEFMQNNSPHKTIYSQFGDRIATYRKLNADSPLKLPEPVSLALKQGQFKPWEIATDHTEIIVRDIDQMKVFRIELENGTEKQTLYFQSDGEQLK